MRLGPDQPLFFEGEAAGRIFMLTKGFLKLYSLLGDGRRQITGFMFPGDFIGFTTDDEYLFSAETLTDAELWAFSKSGFAEFCGSNPDVQRELFHLAAREIAAVQQQILMLGRKNAAERMASYLSMLLARFERISGRHESIIELPMTRIDIADYIGLTKETVSRMIAELRDRRLIRLVNQDRVEILDRNRLDILAEGYGGS
nr:helix-turn-helix domain-containing protein [uncultured Sphingomonas sp.]